MANIVSCNTIDITTSDDCNLKGGITVAFWTQYSSVDWTATAAGATTFDQANQELCGYVMNGTETWNRIDFTKKGSSYTQDYTLDAGSYETTLNFLFKGKGRDFRNAMCQAIGCCKLVIHVFDRNCGERVFGVDWTGDSFTEYVEPLRIIQHTDISGEIGGDEPQDTVVFGGEADCAALYAKVTQSVFEATYL